MTACHKYLISICLPFLNGLTVEFSVVMAEIRRESCVMEAHRELSFPIGNFSPLFLLPFSVYYPFFCPLQN